MGGGKPKNKQNNSSKTTPSKRVLLSGTESGGVPGGEASTNVCIMSFDTTLDVASINDNPPKSGDELFFVPSETASTFNIWFGSTELGAYSGPNASVMWRCANDGYEYHGNVISAENVGGRLHLSCKVETFSRE